MVPAFQVRAIALLTFKPEAGEFDPAEAVDVDDLDEEALDVADAEGDGAGGGVVTELDVVTAGVQDGDDESELGAGSVGDEDAGVVDVAGASWGVAVPGSVDEGEGWLFGEEANDPEPASGPDMVNWGLAFPESPITVEGGQ
jgi:hypothetical protein